MGRGISAGIFLEFEVASRKVNDFSDEFLACYELESEEENLYRVNESFFLENYKGLLEEFNYFFGIEEIGCHCFGDKELTWEDIPDFKTMEEFCIFWDKDNRGGSIPFGCKHGFDTATGIPRLTWLFYEGTYKAHLEDYYSLYHFEKAIQAAIKNPLGKLVKMGLHYMVENRKEFLDQADLGFFSGSPPSHSCLREEAVRALKTCHL